MGFVGLSHIALTVRDLEVSAAWYRRVFDLKHLETITLSGQTQVVLVDPSTDISFNLHVHERGTNDRFDERRVGLDHLSLLVEDRSALERWAEHLDGLGVPRSPIADEDYGSVLVFRDPDNIQLELFAHPERPGATEPAAS